MFLLFLFDQHRLVLQFSLSLVTNGGYLSSALSPSLPSILSVSLRAGQMKM